MEIRAADAEARIATARNRDEALAAAVASADLYMKAIKLAGTKAERKKLQDRCMKVLAIAESIKTGKEWRIETGAMPQPTTALSAREQRILLASSRLHGHIFSPWQGSIRDVELQEDGKTFTDPSHIPISTSRHFDFVGWLRPAEAFQRNGLQAEPTMLHGRDIDLVQDITADCSVVASLCAIVNSAGRGSSELLRSTISPYDDEAKAPAISGNGKYMLRFNFNGSFRKVVVDDRLPACSGSQAMHVLDANNPGLLWPALVEKAYLKVRGGYDFPGSNSGTDIWVLVGWIPEQIFLQSDDLDITSIWDSIYQVYGAGNVLITLGTGRLSKKEEQILGLAGEHDYAVLKLKEVDGRRYMLVKNPWRERSADVAKHGLEGASASAFAMQNLGDALADSPTTSNTFWMTFEQIVSNFASLYLNWNPDLFPHHVDHHFTWDIPRAPCPGSIVDNPQYSLSCTQETTVWVVLTRHFTTEEHSIHMRGSDSSQPTGERTGFISVYVFDANGERVYVSESYVHRGPYVDSPQTSVKLSMPANACYTIVAAEQYLPLPKYSFTISTFSTSPVKVAPAKSYTYQLSTEGSWAPKIAGVTAATHRLTSHPQYKLTLTAASPVRILLETADEDIAVHVKLLFSGGERVSEVTSGRILADSGDYKRHCALAALDRLEAGAYTLIVATHQPGQSGKFRLRIDSQAECAVAHLRGEDAGWLTVSPPLLVLAPGVDRMIAPLQFSRLLRVRAVAEYVGAERAALMSPAKISLELGQGPNKQTLAVSSHGEYGDAVVGLRTGAVDLRPALCDMGGVWVVVERLANARSFEQMKVVLLSDGPLTLGHWGTGQG